MTSHMDLVTIDEAVEIAYPGITEQALSRDVQMVDFVLRQEFNALAIESKTCKYGVPRDLLCSVHWAPRPCEAIRVDQIPLVFTQERMNNMAGCKIVEMELDLKHARARAAEAKTRLEEITKAVNMFDERCTEIIDKAAALKNMFPNHTKQNQEDVDYRFGKRVKV